jgi:hypothetical protein
MPGTTTIDLAEIRKPPAPSALGRRAINLHTLIASVIIVSRAHLFDFVGASRVTWLTIGHLAIVHENMRCQFTALKEPVA